MWEFYDKCAFIFGGNIIHIKYETLLENPAENFSGILDFFSIKEVRIHMKLIINGIDKKHKYAFLSEKNLIDVNKILKRMNL